MTIHVLKTWPKYFRAVLDGSKCFEVRKDDRDYKVGDRLLLREYVPELGQYTGDELFCEVTYCLRESPFAPDGYVVMSIKVIGKAKNWGDELG